jgi:hypothetical protein
MKKLFTILAIVVATSLTITSCTEENVTPTSADNNQGSASTDPFKN